nr:amidase family protein [Tanacetum cinerariifolium]
MQNLQAEKADRERTATSPKSRFELHGIPIWLLHQDKCRVRPVKAAVNDSSIISPSTPPGTVLNLAEESCSTWLDYVGHLITDELDYEKRWS